MGIELIRPDTKIDFMGKRRIAAFLSMTLILIGLISIVIKGGLRYGIDFAGGINIQVKFLIIILLNLELYSILI